jgi:hypothetical protein
MILKKTYIYFLAFIFLLSGCSTRFIVSEIDTSYHGKQPSKKSGNVIATIPKDSRVNKLNVPNFERTWGYLTDRGLYNNVLSSEHVISADIADIIVSVCQARGYNTKVVEPGDAPTEGSKVVESEIMEFWVDSQSAGLGAFKVTTSFRLNLRVRDKDSGKVLKEIEVNVTDKKSKGAASMGQGVKGTTEVFSQNLEKFKNSLYEKLKLD